MGRRTAAPLVVLGAGCAIVAGCGATGKVNPAQVEGNLLQGLKKERPGLTVSASCPRNVPIKTGVTFTCSVSLDGILTRYTVDITKVSGGRYDIVSRPSEPIIDTQQVIASVKQQLGTTQAAAVSCGSARFVQIAVHGTFSCAVVADGQTLTLTATVQDQQGNVGFSGGTPPPTGPPTTAAPSPTLPGD